MGYAALSHTASDDYQTILLSKAPLIDTRAPAEFVQGAFPGAVNLPLMLDDERALVGTCYKTQGQAAAIALGHSLVAGPIKAERVKAWRDFAEAHPNGYLYCFRGGLRSQIAQQWLHEEGIEFPRIAGGYKALRQFALQALQTQCESRRFVVLSGQTGCAKTQLLNELGNAVDLEGLANHRGSAFGKRVGGQPSQIGFENALAIALLKQAQQNGQQMLVLEDESRLIGRIAVPEVLRARSLQAPLVVIEASLAERTEHTFHNYILRNLADWQLSTGEAEGFMHFSNELHASLSALQKRLGGYRFTLLKEMLDSALQAHANGRPESHQAWIEVLLKEYYDPMYAYQLGLKAERVIFRGSYDEVRAYLQTECTLSGNSELQADC
jgi:tRNA 2-selenouridine synthase